MIMLILLNYNKIFDSASRGAVLVDLGVLCFLFGWSAAGFFLSSGTWFPFPLRFIWIKSSVFARVFRSAWTWFLRSLSLESVLLDSLAILVLIASQGRQPIILFVSRCPPVAPQARFPRKRN
jgi:hypothetical protein